MKNTSFGWLRLLAITTAIVPLSLFAQEIDAPASPETRITSPLPDGTPAPPAEPPTVLQTDSSDIIATQKRNLTQREITFQKLKPIELPALPEPIVVENIQETQADFRDNQRAYKVLMLGASVYLPDDNPAHARTSIQIWDRNSRASSTIWVNANFLWLTGFAEFESAGTFYSLILAVSAGGDDAPDITFPSEEKASIVVTEGQPTAEDLAPLEALLKLYNDSIERERLKAAYEGRLREASRLKAERAANPPEKKPLVLQYWRLDEAGLEGNTPRQPTVR